MYAIAASLETKTPIMLLNQPIGFDPSDPNSPYIDGALFQQELLELDNKGYSSISIYINSPGGSVTEGYNIVNAILKSKTPVDTYITGIAASMAAFIFMTGRKRVMCDYGSLMIHNPFGGSDKKMLEAMRVSCLTLFSAKCGMAEKQIEYFMDRETWFTSADAFKEGLCTEIEVTSSANQKRMPLVSARAIWQEANKIQSNLFNTQNMSETNIPPAKALDTSLIAAYLDLNTDSSPSAIMYALKTKINTEVLARGKAEDEMANAKKALDKMKADYEEMKDKYDKMCKEKSDGEASAKKEKEEAEAKAKKELEAADAKAKKVEARSKIEVFAKAEKGNRIKTETIDKYVDMALKTSVEDVVAMLEDLPLNKVAPGSAANAAAAGNSKDAQGNVVKDPTKEGMSAMHLQARIQANAKMRFKSA